MVDISINMPLEASKGAILQHNEAILMDIDQVGRTNEWIFGAGE
jgi:hypothetical protein